MSFQPTGVLSVLTAYQVKVGTGAKDASGQPMAAEFNSSFTTSAAIPLLRVLLAIKPC